MCGRERRKGQGRKEGTTAPLKQTAGPPHQFLTRVAYGGGGQPRKDGVKGRGRKDRQTLRGEEGTGVSGMEMG